VIAAPIDADSHSSQDGTPSRRRARGRLGTVGKLPWRNTSWPDDSNSIVDVTGTGADHFCRHISYLINVGDEKGKILDNAVERTQPRRLLELGTYCGYSALRMARAMPREARLYSVEFNTANAVIARRILAHAGVDDRVTVLVGRLGDGGETIRALTRERNFTPGSLDLVFLDHDKNAYLSDLELILAERWLHPGSVVVADNILVPAHRPIARGCGTRRVGITALRGADCIPEVGHSWRGDGVDHLQAGLPEFDAVE
jgi:predicted O-methyltransferase YrrM